MDTNTKKIIHDAINSGAYLELKTTWGKLIVDPMPEKDGKDWTSLQSLFCYVQNGTEKLPEGDRNPRQHILFSNILSARAVK